MGMDSVGRGKWYVALAACIAVTWPLWSGAQPDVPMQPHESEIQPRIQPKLTIEGLRKAMTRQAMRQDAIEHQLSQLKSITQDLRRRDDQLQLSIYQLQRRIDQLRQRVTRGEAGTGNNVHAAMTNIGSPGKDSAGVTTSWVAVSELETKLNALTD